MNLSELGLHEFKKPTGNRSVIFIHGILSDGKECWVHPETGSYWPEFFNREEGLNDLGVFVFTYRTELSSGTYSIGDAARLLWDELKLSQLTNPSKNLVFVCHSMGGIVARRLIVERKLELIEAQVKTGLFLVASPSCGSDYAKWLNPIAKIMGHTQADALNSAATNAWLTDLDHDFNNLVRSGRLQLFGKELEEDIFTLRGQRLPFRPVVDRPARYFEDSIKVPGLDHSSIAKPADKQALQHRLLRAFIDEKFPS